MDAEGPALPDQAVEPQRSLLRQLVLLDEELLELVHDQQDARERGRSGRVPIAVDVLHSGIAEAVGTEAELGIETLQDAEPELALALDRHHARMRQLVGRVDLELDALLEVDQIQVDLVRAVVQGDVGDQARASRSICRSRFGRRRGRAGMCRALARGAAAWSRPTCRAARRSRPDCRESTRRRWAER